MEYCMNCGNDFEGTTSTSKNLCKDCLSGWSQRKGQHVIFVGNLGPPPFESLGVIEEVNKDGSCRVKWDNGFQKLYNVEQMLYAVGNYRTS